MGAAAMSVRPKATFAARIRMETTFHAAGLAVEMHVPPKAASVANSQMGSSTRRRSAQTITSGARTAAATTSHAALIPPAAVTFAWAREANVARTLSVATLLAAQEARVAG